MATETTLIEIGVLFATAASAGVLANRLGQSVIPFYILAGMTLGQYVLGATPVPEFLTPLVGETFPHLVETDFIYLGAELGIVFLLFFLGLEFNLERLLATKNRIGKAGTIDLVLNFGAGMALGWYFFGDFLAAFVVAGIVYISSSAIITKSLIDLGWIANDEADPMLGTLVYEDLFIAIYLAVVSALVIGSGDIGEAMGQIGAAMAFILGLLVLVYFGTAWFQRALETDSHEFLVLRTLGVLVLVSGGALALGVSEAVAAFFIGMAFSSTDHVHDLEQLLEPLRDTFAAVFFFWIGLLTDPSVFVGVAGMIAIAALLTTPSKLVSGYLGGRIYDLDERRSVRVGLGMVTRGEFSLIIASTVIAASGSGGPIGDGIADTIYAFTVGYVLLMSILGTTLMQYSDRIEAVVLPRLQSGSGTES
ncbi:sodium/hydrogen exchanger [Halostagnicola larsenii XH-48]|uniref:Sodium/hydrogen exchanger n=1 Tax=Halostagnicola larsenii XH-48 TaxID=797299 RepID=W0JRN8_9EURY|nr:cation:proton antiporter [Halostagnicola larsenii]AHF99819.1 sodium/hydrogen exchanger [Halostagnicola larsenii XH-48]